jgi:transposase
MPEAYSKDLRVRVIRAVEAGSSRHRAARLFEVSPSSAIKWCDRWDRTGSVEAKLAKGASRSPLNEHADFLLGLIAAEPDLTLEEIKARLHDKGVETAISSVWRFYDRHAISFKKNRARK